MARKKRPQNRNRLNRVDGAIFNKYGIEFDESEQRKLKNLADSANRKRKRMLTHEGDLTEFFGGISHGGSIRDLSGSMGRESDFILAKKSKSLNRFRSRAEFDSYVEHLQRVLNRDYIPNRIKQYQTNQMKAIKTAFTEISNSRKNRLIRDIKAMGFETFKQLVQQDEASEIWYIYSADEQERKFQALRGAVSRIKKEQ